MYKLEMHLHTSGNSTCGKETPEEIIKIYKNAEYNGIVCTNHFNRYIFNEYLKGETQEEKIENFLYAFRELKKLGKESGIDVFFGVELSLKNDDYHNKLRMKCTELLVYGINPDEFIKYCTSLIEMDYKEFYEFAENKGWLIFQAHPYRERTKRINPHFLHGLEVFNGHPRHFARNKKAYARAKIHGKLTVGGSDFHFKGGEGAGMYFNRVPIDEKDLVNLLKTEKPKIFHN